MYFWVESMNIEQIWWGAYISFFIPIGPSDAVKICYQHIVANIKFSLVIEQRTIQIQLHNKSFRVLSLVILDAVLRLLTLLDYAVEFINLIDNCYPSPLIGILTWLHNPNISHLFVIWHFSRFFSFHLLLSLIVKLNELFILRIVKPVFNVKCQRNILKNIPFLIMVIVS